MVKIISSCYVNGQVSTESSTVSTEKDNKWIEANAVNVYPEIEYQTLIGIGGAVTEAAGYVYSTLNVEKKKQFIAAYYGENGNNYLLGRCSIDSCDFGLGNYSAKNTEDGEFSLARDEKYIMPLLDDIKKELPLRFRIHRRDLFNL